MTKTATPPGTTVFPLLAEPRRYVACSLELTRQNDQRRYWLDHIATHFSSRLLERAVEEALARGEQEASIHDRARRSREHFEGFVRHAREEPSRTATMNIMDICVARQHALAVGGFDDPYRLVKQKENTAAEQLLPGLLCELDAMDVRRRAQQLVEGMFAGNIFDLGAVQTAMLFDNGQSVDFHAVRGKLKPRRWLIDDLDQWVDRITGGPAYRCAVIFVDNAGCDVVLGMIPFARELLRQGTAVILTANSRPALNDITHEELSQIIDGITQWDRTMADALGAGQLQLIASGNGVPLIDLTRVSTELAEATNAREADLVVLEGMGRAIESNFDAPFLCDVIKIAMLKDPAVAQALGGQTYDLVMRFERPTP